MEHGLELLPKPFTSRDKERLLQVPAWTSRKFVREMERRGLVRDLNYPIARAERGSILQDARNAYIKEIGVGAGGTGGA